MLYLWDSYAYNIIAALYFLHANNELYDFVETQ